MFTQAARKQRTARRPDRFVFFSPARTVIPVTKEFKVSRIGPPEGFEKFFEDTVLLERIREVRALLGFTRIESKGDFADAAYVDDGRETPLSRKSSTRLTASEVRGEGIFIDRKS